MLRSFVQYKVAINISLGYACRTDLNIDKEEIKIIESLVQFLQVFEKCTETLQGQQFSTLSLNILFLDKMKKS